MSEQKLAAIHARIAAAAALAGRKPEDVALIAVSKTREPPEILQCQVDLREGVFRSSPRHVVTTMRQRQNAMRMSPSARPPRPMPAM